MIQALILQGIGPTIVSQKTGVNKQTISTLAYRHGWKRTVDTARQTLQIDAQKGLADDVARASVSVRKKLSGSLADASDVLQGIRTPKRSMKAVKAKLDAVATAVQAADKLFGWSESQSETLVSVQVLRELAESGVEPAGQVLDVQTEEPTQGIMSHKDRSI